MSYAAAAAQDPHGGPPKSTGDSVKANAAASESQYEHFKAETAEAAEKAKRFANEESKKLSRDAKRAEKSLAKKTKEVSAQVQEGWRHLSSDPKAWGTLLGAVNLALLGGLGYFVYNERKNAQTWDRRVVSAVSVGVLGLLGGQGYFAAETARKQQGKK
ncbi:unnamed protein product [Parajaminaea phylloscopi]